jgi:hypothetical protein
MLETWALKRFEQVSHKRRRMDGKRHSTSGSCKFKPLDIPGAAEGVE